MSDPAGFTTFILWFCGIVVGGAILALAVDYWRHGR